jgi:hypothetical protein
MADSPSTTTAAPAATASPVVRRPRRWGAAEPQDGRALATVVAYTAGNQDFAPTVTSCVVPAGTRAMMNPELHLCGSGDRHSR